MISISSKLPALSLAYTKDASITSCANVYSLKDVSNKVSNFSFPDGNRYDPLNIIVLKERKYYLQKTFGQLAFDKNDRFLLSFIFDLAPGEPEPTDHIFNLFSSCGITVDKTHKMVKRHKNGDYACYEKFFITLAPNFKYGFLQLFNKVDISSNKQVITGGTVHNYFIFPSGKDLERQVIPPVITFQPNGWPFFLYMREGQFLQIITMGDKWSIDHRTDNRGLKFYSTETSPLFDKKCHINYYKYGKRPVGTHEILSVTQNFEGTETTSQIIIPASIRYCGKGNDILPVINEPKVNTGMVVFARNIDGFVMKKHNFNPHAEWVYNSDDFYVFNEAGEIKVRFYGHVMYAMLYKHEDFYFLKADRNLVPLISDGM